MSPPSGAIRDPLALNPRRDRHADGGAGDLGKGKNELSGQAAARTCAVHCERQEMRDKAGVSQLLENARTAIWLSWANNSPSPALRISLMRNDELAAMDLLSVRSPARLMQCATAAIGITDSGL